ELTGSLTGHCEDSDNLVLAKEGHAEQGTMSGLDQLTPDRALIRPLGGDVGNLDRLPSFRDLRGPALPLGHPCHAPDSLEPRSVALAGVMAHAQMEPFARFVVLPDRAARSSREFVRPQNDGLEHGLEIQRRAERASDLPERRELAHRACQLPSPCPELTKK